MARRSGSSNPRNFCRFGVKPSRLRSCSHCPAKFSTNACAFSSANAFSCELTRLAPVPDIVSFRVDFADWLKNLGRRDRRITERLSLSHRTQDVARRFKISEARVSQLRGELAASWRKFVGDVRGNAAA